MKKYKLTNNTYQTGVITLHQIQALKSFGSVQKGDLGGWIEKESNLSQEGNAWVFGDAPEKELPTQEKVLNKIVSLRNKFETRKKGA